MPAKIDLFRSAPVRAALLFLALLGITIAASFGILYVKINGDFEKQQRAEIIDIQKIISSKLPIELLQSTADSQIIPITGDDTVFLITNGNGSFIAGNIRGVPVFTGWRSIPLNSVERIGGQLESENGETLLGTWTNFRDGMLFVGTSDADIVEAREMLIEALGLALSVAAVVALAGAVLLARRVRRRIETISQALDAASDGDLAIRIPYQDTGDELDQIAARINTTMSRLDASMASLRQVTSDIAHDLKSPISRIRQRLQRAINSSVPENELRSLLVRSVTEIDQVVVTFNALLNISQIEGGMQRRRFTPQLLQPILAAIVDAYAAVAEEVGHELRADFSGLGNAVVFGDRDLLSQLLVNLVENAVTHCPKGSLISITATKSRRGPLVTVSDNGPGIPTGERSKVFRRLYRLEKSRSTPGSGLGLSLVSAIANLHEATVELGDNCPGLRINLQFPNFDEKSEVVAA